MTTKFKGNTVQLDGQFITPGTIAPEVALVKSNLNTLTLADCKGKHIDTGICATSVRKFNQLAASLPNTVVLCISRDLPFAQGRFCAAEGIEGVVTLSDFRRSSTFGIDYGVQMADGPLAGLLARAVVIIAPNGEVTYSELVPEITTEPNYEEALKAIKD